MYFLGLSLATCSDTASHSDGCKTVECTHIEIASDVNHPEGDDCSPLCMCHCCGGVTLVNEIEHIFKVNFSSFRQPLYSETSISEISFSVWQPPKIS